MAFSNGSDNTLVYGLYQDKMMYRLAAYNGWNTASNSVGYGLSQGVLSKYMTPAAHRDMLTTQYLDNWAYQANVRDYVSRMDQKLEAHTITPVYASRNQELQSLAKTQLQRYASTYLGVDPRTIDVTLPWQRLFEVYVDVKRRRPYRLKPMCAGASITSAFRTWPITSPQPKLSSMRPKPSMKTAP